MKEESSGYGFTRRDFLRAAGFCLLGGVSIGKGLSLYVNNTPVEGEKYGKSVERVTLPLDEEEFKSLQEIAEYRGKLGMVALPVWAKTMRNRVENWVSEKSPFNNELAEKIQSYGMFIEKVSKLCFGENAERLIKGAKCPQGYSGQLAFSPTDKYCVVPLGIVGYPINGNFVDIVFHEASGHGSDLENEFDKIPTKVLIKIAHGKWEALSRMFSVPNELMNNAGDTMYPMLKRQTGKYIGAILRTEQTLENILDLTGQGFVYKTLAIIAREKGIDPVELKFNKAVCRRISEILIPNLLQGNVEFKNHLKDFYSAIMERVGVEIYAEEVKYAVLNPEKMQHDPDILGGIKEVLETLSESTIDLESIRQNAHPDPETLVRNQAESDVVAQVNKSLQNPVQPPNENQSLGVPEAVKPEMVVPQKPVNVQVIAQQEVEINRAVSAFERFMNTGEYPPTVNIPQEYAESARMYGKRIAEFTHLYPSLLAVDLAGNDGFDPDMDLWDIEDLGYARDTGYINGLIALNSLDDYVARELDKKTEILERYINHPALNSYL